MDATISETIDLLASLPISARTRREDWTPNAWHGADNGALRLAMDVDRLVLYAFTDDRRYVVAWSVGFSSDAPVEVIAGAVQAAQRILAMVAP